MGEALRKDEAHDGAPVAEAPSEDSAPHLLPDSSRDMYLPVGVKDDQDPSYTAYLPRDKKADYKGFAVPWNLYINVLNANALAVEAKVRFSVLTGAAGRLIKKFGPDRAEKISLGQGDNEEKAYFDKLLELERMMSCFLQAIVEVLGIQTFQGVVSSLREMRDVEVFRTDVLQAVRAFRDKMGPQDMMNGGFFGTETTVRSALKSTLPKEMRENPNLQILNGGEINPQLQSELDYPRTNAGMKAHILSRRNGSVICHVGSDFVQVGSKNASTNECLREVAGRFLGIPEYERYWILKRSLDGGAFSAGSSGKAQRVVPYYLEENDINPTQKLPLRLPGLPHVQGWVSERMRRSGGGGLAPGPATDYVGRWVKPVAQTYMRAGGDTVEQLKRKLRFANDPHGQIGGHKLEGLSTWAELPPAEAPPAEAPAVMPNEFEGTGEIGDLIRIISMHIAERFAGFLAATP